MRTFFLHNDNQSKLNSNMKYLTHWSTAFITLVLLTYIGLQDPWFKETLRLKSFDYLLANEEVTPSKDITIITIDEQAIGNMVNGLGLEMY